MTLRIALLSSATFLAAPAAWAADASVTLHSNNGVLSVPGHLTDTLATVHLPAFTGGDAISMAGTASITVNTVKGKAVLPIDGSVPMTGGLSITNKSGQSALSMFGVGGGDLNIDYNGSGVNYLDATTEVFRSATGSTNLATLASGLFDVLVPLKVEHPFTTTDIDFLGSLNSGTIAACPSINGFSLSWNYNGGVGESDFEDCYNAGGGFDFYHRTSAPSATTQTMVPLLQLRPAGASFGVPVNAGANIQVAGPAVLNTSYASASNVAPANAGALATGGDYISICTLFSCSAGFDHIRTAWLLAHTTQDDGHSQEDGLTILGQVRTGYKTPWAASTSYAVGANVTSDTNGKNVYRATTAGTSGTSGGPTGTTSNASWTDGTVTWTWINAAAIDGKVGGIYTEVGAYGASSGSTWNNAFNFQLQPGHIPQYDTNTEFDLYNGAQNCAIGTNCLGIAVLASGPYQSTTGVYINGAGTGQSGTGNYSLLWGLRTSGALAALAAIEDDSSSPIGIGIGANTYGTYSHSTAAILDQSTTPFSYIAGGTYASAAFVANPKASSPGAYQALGPISAQAFNDGSSAPISYYSGGTHTTATFNDGSTSPYSLLVGGTHSAAAVAINGTIATGIQFLGSYSTAQVTGQGWKIDPTGNETVLSETVQGAANQLLQLTYNTSGDFGQIQSIHTGTYTTTLKLNPSGGLVQVGASGLSDLGPMQFGTYTAGAATNTGYITITDAGGTTRHLAVVP